MSNYSNYVNTLSLVGWWRFGEAVGTADTIDETGNYTVPTPTSITKGLKSLVPNDTDLAYSFPGTVDQVIAFATKPTSTDANFTLNIIVKTSSQGTSLFFQLGNLHMGIEVDGTLRIYKDGTNNNIQTTTIVSDNVVHMLTYVNDSLGNSKLFIDGVLSASGALNIGQLALDEILSTLSTAWPTNLAGIVDEVIFFNQSLTDTQVADLWTFASELPQYKIDYTINEALPQDQWDVSAYHLADKTLSGTQRVTNGANTITFNAVNVYPEPHYLTVVPYQGDIWTAGITVAAGDLVFPTDPVTTPYYYRCTVPGTTGTTEPTWPTSTGSSVTDGTATWEFVGALVQPITQSPIIPVKIV